MSNISCRWFYLAAIGLLMTFIIKFISFTKIINFFPMNLYSDLALKLSELYLLANYGFHATVPHWYNGFTLFQVYPPGWYFFSLPIYMIADNIRITALISLVIILILGFIASSLIFKKFPDKIIFFVFFFMNPIMIDYIFFIGRLPELFGWVIYLFIFYLVFKYKNIRIETKGFFLFTILLSLIIITHQYTSFPALLLIFSLFLIKPKKEKFIIFVFVLLSIVLTSFYWQGLAKVLIDKPYAVEPTQYQKGELLSLTSIVSFNTLTLLLWFFIFYFYHKDFIKSRKEKLFFYPFLLLSILILTRLTVFIPLFNEIPPNAYNLFFISLSLYMLFKIKFPETVKKLLILAILIFPILTALVAFEIREGKSIEYTQQQEEAISYFSRIDNNYIIISDNGLSHNNALIGLATVDYNLTTPMGLYSTQLPKSLNEIYISTDKSIKSKNCFEINNNFEKLKTKYIIYLGDNCNFLSQCKLTLLEQQPNSCLLSSNGSKFSNL